MITCKICRQRTRSIISFGQMPIANGFTTTPSAKEFVFNLQLMFCPNCCMVQLKETIPPTKMFHNHYQFFSSTSKGMEKHFETQATHIKKIIKNKTNPFVIEIGSNDGIMLKHIASSGIKHLGIEPSKNVAAVSKKYGVNITSVFFNKKNAQDIAKKYGQADIICGSNVICHIENINSVFAGVSQLLADDGYFFFEEPYIYDIIRNNSFDQIYDEHVYYYSGLSINNLAKKHKLQLVGMKHQDVHGGSMRYYLKKGRNNKVSPSVIKYISIEKKHELHLTAGYEHFKKNVDKISLSLINILKTLDSQGYKVAGYAATSKSTTLLNYARIGKDLIKYISDTTPSKIGLFTPGTAIPVKSHQYFLDDKPKYTVLFAYNHKKEIMAKEKAYRKQGGKFITYFPKVTIE